MRHLWIITRKHPPAVGGMEQVSARIAGELSSRRTVTIVKWGGSQKLLPVFMLLAAARLCVGLARGRVGVLFLGDPVLSALGVFARWFRVPVMVTVHGLDVVWPNTLYQAYLRAFFFGRMDTYVCISSFVRDLLVSRRVAPQCIRIIPLGVAVPAERKPAGSSGPTLLYLGRLVPRKGVAWFIANVLPPLVDQFPSLRMVVAGDGPESGEVRKAAASGGVAHVVDMRGSVSEAEKHELFASCTAVVMPNVEVRGDVEGFGLVALEAAAWGAPVFAADLEGLRDAIRPGVSGWLLPTGDTRSWVAAISAALRGEELARVSATARQHVERSHAWSAIGQRYDDLVESLQRAQV